MVILVEVVAQPLDSLEPTLSKPVELFCSESTEEHCDSHESFG